MAAKDQGQLIDPGIVARVSGAIRGAVTGWLSAGKPTDIVAPQGTSIRNFDYPVGYNLTTQNSRQRVDGGVSFPQLRNLADYCWQVRAAIETVKDKATSVEYSFRLKPEDGESNAKTRERAKKDPRVAHITQFFLSPDAEHDRRTWLRMLLEEALVHDALSIYKRPTLTGDPFAIEIIDGTTIFPQIDDTGRRPLPPERAYTQYIKGLPIVPLTQDELLYCPRNPRAGKVYGFSPVEQLVTIVNMALRRSTTQMSYFTTGNIPRGLFGVPETWSSDDISKFQRNFDSYMNDPEMRSKMIFMPGGGTPVFPQDAILKDEFDEWLMRCVCFVFSISPNFFIKQQNRASSENYWNEADEQGLLSWLPWIKQIHDEIIERWFVPWWERLGLRGEGDVEFVPQHKHEIDAKQRAEIDGIYLDKGVYSIDDVREREGLDPIGVPPMISTISGPVPVAQAVANAMEPKPDPVAPPAAVEDGQTNADAKKKPPVDPKNPGDKKPDEKPAEKAMHASLKKNFKI